MQRAYYFDEHWEKHLPRKHTTVSQVKSFMISGKQKIVTKYSLSRISTLYYITRFPFSVLLQQKQHWQKMIHNHTRSAKETRFPTVERVPAKTKASFVCFNKRSNFWFKKPEWGTKQHLRCHWTHTTNTKMKRGRNKKRPKKKTNRGLVCHIKKIKCYSTHATQTKIPPT